MPIDLPATAEPVINRVLTDMQREMAGSNPFLKNSRLKAIGVSNANSVFDFYVQLGFAIDESLPDTAVANLERWAAIFGITRLAATAANGAVVFGGTPGSIVPLNTVLSSSDGLLYLTQATGTITSSLAMVTSITRSGQTVTVTTTTNHNLSNNIPVTIAGADQSEYNVVDVAIQVISPTQFTYQVTGSPVTPATGTITAAYDSLSSQVVSSGQGANNNQAAGALLTLQSPIVGVDNEAGVDADELGNGTDQETNDALRVRLLDRIQNPVANFNVAAITAEAKKINGVTRVFVQEVTPALGQVTIFFMRDNDDNPIPTAPEVVTVKNQILTIKPANTSDVNVIVEAPTPVSTDFIFNALVPNTTTMNAAVQASLEQFYAESPEVGVSIDEDAYRSAIFNTVDTATGDVVTSFDLTAPVGNIPVTTGEIGVLGTVTPP